MRWCWDALIVYGSRSSALFDPPTRILGPRARSSWPRGNRGFCCGRPGRPFLSPIGGTVIASADELFLCVLLLVSHNKIIKRILNTIQSVFLLLILSFLLRAGPSGVIICIATWGGCERGGLVCFCRVGSFGRNRFLCEWNCNDFRTCTNYCS